MAAGCGAALTLVLALVAAEQYGGGALPQYGADYERADYRHSPDAPPHLDYNFDDDTPHDEGDKALGYAEAERGRKSARDEKSLASEDAREVSGPNERRAEPKDRARRRPWPGRTPRSRERRRPPPPEHYGDAPDYGNGADFPDDGDRETTLRAGRKPRERVFVPPPPPPRLATEAHRDTGAVAEEEEPPAGRRSGADDADYWSGRAPAPARRRTPPSAAPPSTARRSSPAYYPDYNDYYDPKKIARVKNIVPPDLILRSTTPAPEQTPRQRFRANVGGGEAPVAGRRAGAGGGPGATATSAAPAPAAASTTSVTVVVGPGANDSQPSLAERSRLSILRKAQLKESSGKAVADKPPVLLQVTRRVPTVVMVAAGDPWQRARLVADDSPDTLDKVKRLMRQKLVASAKNIRELTDNWDDIVCDYVDVSLLESGADRGRPAATLLLPALLLLNTHCGCR